MKKILTVFVLAAILGAALISCRTQLKKDGSGFTALDHLAFGSAWLESKDYQRAEGSFRKAIELDPKSGDAYIQLGFLYYVLYEKEVSGDKAPDLMSQYYNQSFHSLEQGIKNSPKNPRGYTGLARLLEISKQFSKAVENLLKAKEAAKVDDISTLIIIENELAICYLSQNNLPKAREAYTNYLELISPSSQEYQAVKSIIREIERQIEMNSNLNDTKK